MTQGIGAALGVAVVTLDLHAGAIPAHPGEGAGLSTAALAPVALAAAWAGLRPGTRAGHGRPGPAGGTR